MKKLHLGCGTEHRKGWVNIDANKKCKPNIVSPAHRLPMFKNGSADVIEACHLLEHLPYLQGIKALREWNRILKRGGLLFLELPDFARCVAILGKFKDPKGYDMGMIGIYGHPPMVETDGLFQTHKWGWTAPALIETLTRVGFTEVTKIPPTQKWRLAHKMNTKRDMRIRAVK